MDKARSTYTVRYERDESGWWIAEVKEVQGCRTQGRTIEETRRRMREALGLFVDNAETATLVDDVKLPSPVRTAVGRYERARGRLVASQEDLGHSLVSTIALLSDAPLSLSTRDAGAILGLSHQRIHQLMGESEGRSTTVRYATNAQAKKAAAKVVRKQKKLLKRLAGR